MHYFKLLFNFNYKIIHYKGTKNKKVNALSRKEKLFKNIPKIKA